MVDQGQFDRLSLMGLFDEFYQTIGDVKRALRDGVPGDALAKVVGSRERIKDADQAAVISDFLRRKLEQQAKLVATYGSAADRQAYVKAQYFMAALADELFLLLINWRGQDEWLEHMLERALFGTSIAGNRFFQSVDELLKQGLQIAFNDKLAAIALLTLRLGFKGALRHRANGNAKIKQYRSRLYRLVGNMADFSDGQKLFSRAYDHMVFPSVQTRLAPVSRWHRICIIAAIVYVVLSSVLWHTTIAPVQNFLNG